MRRQDAGDAQVAIGNELLVVVPGLQRLTEREDMLVGPGAAQCLDDGLLLPAPDLRVTEFEQGVRRTLAGPYYVEWHMRERLKPMLFDDEQIELASAGRASPVTKAVRSAHAKQKDKTKLADDGLPLHSFRTLLQDLATLAYNVTHTQLNPNAKVIITTRPTPIQDKAFKLLGLNPACTQ